MDQRQLVELLSLHADRLRDDRDVSAEVLAAAPAEDQGALEALLGLARRVQAALVPAEPRPDFVAELKQRLGVMAPPAPARGRRLVMVGAGLSGLVYLVSLGLLTFRLALLGRNMLSGIMGARAARAALPGAQPVP